MLGVQLDDLDGSEPVRGLPEAPPEGERILWQGKPDWRALAREALAVRIVAVYFIALAFWRGLSGWAVGDMAGGVSAAALMLAMGAAACALLYAFAYVQARVTVYTVTTRRVVMRVGAALTVTLNIPYKWINSADLALAKNGTGTLAFDLRGETRFSYLAIWPHVRPWRMKKTQPALRAIPDAKHVAEMIAEHAATEIADRAPRPAPRPAHAVAAE